MKKHLILNKSVKRPGHLPHAVAIPKKGAEQEKWLTTVYSKAKLYLAVGRQRKAWASIQAAPHTIRNNMLIKTGSSIREKP